MNSSDEIVRRLKIAIAYELFKHSPDGRAFSFDEIKAFFPSIPPRFISEALPHYTSKSEILRKSDSYISGAPRDHWHLASKDWMAIFDQVAKPTSPYADYMAQGNAWIMGDVVPGSAS